MNHPIATRPSARRLARRLGVPTLVLAATLLGACATTGAGGDGPLVDEVYQAIRADAKLGATEVTVTNEGNGVVALHGFVADMADEESIIEAAEAVEGVRSVDSNLPTVGGG